MKNLKRVLALLSLLFLAACAPAAEPVQPGGWVNGPINEAQPGASDIFVIPVAAAGDPIGIDFSGSVTSGSVRAVLKDPSGQILWEQAVPVAPGPFAYTTTLRPETPGDYQLGYAWEASTQATYSIVWRPEEMVRPGLTPVVLVPGIGMILVALAFLVYSLLRRLPFRYFLFGGLAWVVTVALKFAWAIPFNSPIYKFLTENLPDALGFPIFYLYVGLLTGVFEVALTWLVLRYTRLGKAPWRAALAFGIGFGALEAFLLGLNSLVGTATALLLPNVLPLSTLESVAQANSWLYSLMPPWERFFTVWIHIFCNTMLFLGVAQARSSRMWVAFLYKSLIDALAAWVQVAGVKDAATLWMVEGVIALWGGLGWWAVVRWVQPRYPAEEPPAAAPAPESEAATL